MKSLSLTLLMIWVFTACSPRDYLTRRLAADLIAGSEAFNEPQQFWLRTGIISNKDYTAPEYLVLRHRGWIIGSSGPCPPEVSPPPCWDVSLTPLGVDTFHDILKDADPSKQSFSIPVARRELVAVTGISKSGNDADVEFTFQWVATSEVGAALTTSGLRYRSTVAFKRFDDGWRVVQANMTRDNQSLEDALKTAVPTS
jgi:hypothetical protein